MTQCSFTHAGTAYGCEFSVFGQFPLVGDAVSAKMVAPVDDFGCDAGNYAKDEFEGKLVLLPRGVCPFYDKAVNVAKSGAAVLVVYDSEEDVNPVRMKGTGEEEEIVRIPSVMISREDGLSLTEIIRESGAGSRGNIEITIDIDDKYDENGEKYILNEEYELKRAVFLSDFENTEKIMQLGAFFSLPEWTETAGVYLKYAGSLVTEPKDYDLVYSIGEYVGRASVALAWSVRTPLHGIFQIIRVVVRGRRSRRGSAPSRFV